MAARVFQIPSPRSRTDVGEICWEEEAGEKAYVRRRRALLGAASLPPPERSRSFLSGAGEGDEGKRGGILGREFDQVMRGETGRRSDHMLDERTVERQTTERYCFFK